MTAEQKLVHSVLENCRGKDRAIRVQDLASATNIPEREVREIVTALILVFHIRIGSCYSGKHPGYYIICTPEESEETSRVLRHHALSILKRAAVVERISLEDLLGQLALEVPE
jgi:hypothetical protein